MNNGCTTFKGLHDFDLPKLVIFFCFLTHCGFDSTMDDALKNWLYSRPFCKGRTMTITGSLRARHPQAQTPLLSSTTFQGPRYREGPGLHFLRIY